MADPRYFRSRRDAGRSALLGGMIIALSAAGGWLLRDDHPGSTVAGVILLVGCAVVIWVAGGTYYAFRGRQLVLHFGPFFRRLPVSQIVKAEPATSNPVFGPALCLDRLMLTLRGGREIMISPDDKDGFLAELVARWRPSSGSARA